jgi:3'-5' exoribonuclease
MKIKEFKEKQRIELPLLLSGMVSGVTASGAPYLSLTLQDDSGLIEGKIWDVKDEVKELCVVGKVISVTADAILYRGVMQLKIIGVKALDQALYHSGDYIQQSPIDVGLLQDSLTSAINGIKNDIIRQIVLLAVDKYGKAFYDHPAASRNHHDFKGGLATHIKGMLDLGIALCQLYPSLNQDLLVAGILLHDLGKLEELSGPVATEYTTIGKLIGHISITQALVNQLALELHCQDSEEVILLRHMILSHHGEYEYGSPVLPLTREAEVLNYIDNLDARMNMIDKALETVGEGEFTARIFALENRSFYRHKVK